MPYSANFNDRIVAAPVDFGLTAAQATRYTAVHAPYVASYEAMTEAREAGNRSQSLTAAKDTAKAELLEYGRELYAFVQANTMVSNANKELLGVHVRDVNPTPIPPPSERPGILGELKKPGMRAICRSMVLNILRRHGLDPSPHRKKAMWDTFIKRHSETLWACDLLQRKVLTLLGWRYLWVLVFINVKTRMAWVSPSTGNPDCEWNSKQAEAFMQQTAESSARPTMVIHDRDGRFGPLFRSRLRACGTDSYMLPFRSPNLNAYIERFIQTLQQECLDHFLVFGTTHMDHLLKEFLAHYHGERPHQSIGNVPPIRAGPPPLPGNAPVDIICCRSRLGGLLRHYERKAA